MTSTLASSPPGRVVDDRGRGCSRQFVARLLHRYVCPQAESAAREGRPDRELYRQAGEMGLLCMSIPEEYGGGGGTFAHEAALLTEQTLAGDTSLHLGVDAVIVPHYILAYGPKRKRSAIFRNWLQVNGSPRSR